MRHRWAFVAASLEEARCQIDSICREPVKAGTVISGDVANPRSPKQVRMMVGRVTDDLVTLLRRHVLSDPSLYSIMQEICSAHRLALPCVDANGDSDALLFQVVLARWWSRRVDGLHLQAADTIGTLIVDCLKHDELTAFRSFVNSDRLLPSRPTTGESAATCPRFEFEMPLTANSLVKTTEIIRAVPHDHLDKLRILAELYAHGATLLWASIFATPGQIVSTPPYPFEHKTLWMDLPVVSSTLEDKPMIPEEENRRKTLSVLARELRQFVARLLEIGEPDIQSSSPLLEIGADSIALAEIVRFIRERFGIEIALRQLFEELLTIEHLAMYISEQQKLPATNISSDLPRRIETRETSFVLHSMDRDARRTDRLLEIRDRISSFVASLTGVPVLELDSSKALLEIGADSMVLAEVVRFVRDNFGVSIALRQMFEEILTIDAIALFVTEQLPDALQQIVLVQPPKPADSRQKAAGPLNATESEWRATKNRVPGISSDNPETSVSRIIQGYLDRTPKSRELAIHARTLVCNNRRSLSQIRPEMQPVSYPIRVDSSRGAHFRDIDGNSYVDLSMGFGVNLFGHNPPFVVEAIQRQLARGIHLGPENDMVGDVAEGIAALTGVQRMLFCTSGTEAVMTAMRIARAHRARSKIALFRNAYHGHFDATLVVPESGQSAVARPMAAGTPVSMVSDILVLPFDSRRALDEIEARADEIAAVLVEPIQNRRPDLQPQQFLVELRQLTRRHGILLIFDEILIGFRIHQGGAQAWFGVEADLVTYAKIIGGGMPIGVVAGKSEVMAHTDGGSSFYLPGDVGVENTIYTAGTYCKHPLTMAACSAVVRELRSAGPGLQLALNRKGDELAETLNREFSKLEIPLGVFNSGSFFRFAQNHNLSFVYQPRQMDLFNVSMVTRGIYIVEGGTCFLSTAHSDSDVEQIIEAALAAGTEIRDSGLWREPVKSGNISRQLRAQDAAAADISTDAEASTTRGNDGGPTDRNVDFSLSFFGSYSHETKVDPYDLLIQAAACADKLGFAALWFPERHFDEFGGPFPNPSVLAAAVSRETRRIRLRAGSVVAPLHHPARIAEEWAVVDRLSGGRAEIAFASGWHANDFVLAPENFAERRAVMDRAIRQVQTLWKGGSIKLRNGAGDDVAVHLYPKPIQPELPIWLAALGNPETFEKAGRLGAGVLTNLVAQDFRALENNIAIYRNAMKSSGFGPERYRVAVLVHTWVGQNADDVRARASAPLKSYFKSSFNLAVSTTESSRYQNAGPLPQADQEYLFNRAFDSYVSERSLIGSVEGCGVLVRRLVEAGASEIACFIDFGVPSSDVLAGLTHLNELRRQWQTAPGSPTLARLAPTEPTFPVSIPINEKVIPTSPNQNLLWLAGQFDRRSSAYDVRTSLALDGELNVAALERAVHRLVSRHGALRAVFPGDDGDRQCILDKVEIDIPLVDLSNLPEETRAEEVARWYRDDAWKPIDVEHGPVFRISLLRLGAQHHRLVISVNHIVYDGFSERILIKELGHLYSLEVGVTARRLPLALDYEAEIRRQIKEANNNEPAKRFWRDKIAGVPKLGLPYDNPVSSLKTHSGARLISAPPPNSVNDLRLIAGEHHVTPYILLLNAYAEVLHRICRQREIMVGISVDVRAGNEGEALIANSSNLVPIRFRHRADADITSRLKETKGAVLDAYEHANVPFAQIMDLANAHEWTSAPVVSTCFNWDHITPPDFGEMQPKFLRDPARYVRFPLSLNVACLSNIPSGSKEVVWEFEWDYNTDLFNEETVKVISREFNDELRSVQESQNISLARSSNSRRANAGSIYAKILQHVVSLPEHIAVHDETTTLTYAELAQLAGAMAARLRQLDVGPGDVVGVFLTASVQAVISILAIWEVGAAFAALDVVEPSHRLDGMLRTAGVKAVIASREQPLPLDGFQTCNVEDIPNDPRATLRVGPTSSSDLAYVVFSSGTTGVPKAVAVEHAHLSGYLDAICDRLDWQEHGSFLFVSPLNVDLGYTMLFGSLAYGGTLHIASREAVREPRALATFAQSSNVDYLKITPTHLQAMLEHPEAPCILPKKMLILGGEPLTWGLVEDVWRVSPDLSIVNHYGPTETTVGVTCYRIERDDKCRECYSVPIGSPLGNAKISLVGEDGAPIEEGEIGEIVVHGPTVARGYIDNSTAHGRLRSDAATSQKWTHYSTGDLARLLADGNIVFVGRKDDQVKIRGHRVDLNEITAALSKISGAGHSIATYHERYGIVGWVVTKDVSQAPIAATMRRDLANHLPDYMIPSRFEYLDTLPIGKSGKVDKVLLRRKLENDATPVDPGLIRDAEIERMLTLWREVLKQEPIDIDDDFFGLGGHSIHAIRLLARVRRVFGVEISIRTLFDRSSPRALLGVCLEQKAASTMVQPMH